MAKYSFVLSLTFLTSLMLVYVYLKLIRFEIHINYIENSSIFALNRFGDANLNLKNFYRHRANRILSSISKAANNKYFSHEENTEIKKFLKIYDLKKTNTYHFDCVKSALVLVQTTICLHAIQNDVFISQNIKSSGSWETEQLRLFMRILDSNKNIQVFDIGAQLGQFTLFAAKLGRKVIAVEPFSDSFIRIHKAAQLESLTDKITLITNGVSNKRGIVKKLKKNDKNIGGQGIDENSPVDASLINKDKFYLRTIEMDDLITVLPRDFSEAIMKIDIEDYEIKAFKKADKLFARVKFHAVFIEWMGKNRASRFTESDINIFLDFMYSRGFLCRNPLNLVELKRESWRFWPGDVVWLHTGLSL